MNTLLKKTSNIIACGLFISTIPAHAAIIASYNTDDFYIDSSKNGYSSLSDTVTVTGSNGVITLNFNGYVNAYASTYSYFGYDEDVVDVYAPITFSTTASETITGYQITYHGEYNIESPGTVGIDGFGTSFYSSTNPSTSAFSHTDYVSATDASLLIGQVIAIADTIELEVLIGYEEILVDVIELCDYDEISMETHCTYEEIYEQNPIYSTQMDLGDASINLSSITVEAQISSVPLPASWLLFAASMLSLAGRKVLRRAN